MSIDDMEKLRKRIIKNNRIIGLIVLGIIICCGIFAYYYYTNNKSNISISTIMPVVVVTFILCIIIYSVLYAIFCATKVDILKKKF